MPTGFRSMPVLPCRDVERCAQFYNEKLGFAPVNLFKEHDGPAQFAITGLGKITIAFQHVANWVPHESGWSAYLYIDDAKALYAIASARGVQTHGLPQETFYGTLEFEIRDPEGHWIAFGQDLNPGTEGPGL